MKAAVTSAGPTLEAEVDPRFGRCAYFLIVDTDTMEFEAIGNPNAALGQGAGIQSAQLLATRDVEVLLTGNCGPNAHEALSAARIEMILGCSGSVMQVIGQFKAGHLTAANKPNVPGHSGMAGEPPPAPAQTNLGDRTGAGNPGGDRGMGRGRGRGRGGRGGGMGQGGGGRRREL
jgi:predicted Fe-Mo cluster-binding NifX family protein